MNYLIDFDLGAQKVHPESVAQIGNGQSADSADTDTIPGHNRWLRRR